VPALNDERRLRAPTLLALGLYCAWTLATYLLEGRLLTLLRPDAAGARLLYTLVANVLIGVVGAGLVLQLWIRRTAVTPERFGFRSPLHTLLSVGLGTGIGFAVFYAQQPVVSNALVLTNAFAQVAVVSMAEVLVCWVVLGRSLELAVGSAKWPAVLLSWVLSAISFGAYHFAHSPPFNTLRMVGLLAVVGLGTGLFFVVSGEIYGTVALHNFMALKGVTDALAERGGLTAFETLRPELVATAIATAGVLVSIDWLTRRRAARSLGFHARQRS
jgi:hypothetical protein